MPQTARDIEDAIAPGLESLRAVFSGDDDPKQRGLAEFYLKSMRNATAKRGAENNELRSTVSIFKLVGANAEELRPVFEALVGRYSTSPLLTSGDAGRTYSKALAAPKGSTDQPVTGTARRTRGRTRKNGNRSQIAA